jgi:molecular chaperone GrpE
MDAKPEEVNEPASSETEQEISPEQKALLEEALAEAEDLIHTEETQSPEAIIAEYEAKLEEGKDQVLRMAAENENLRRRAQRDVEESNKYAVTSFARDMVSVIENLQRASSAVPDAARAGNEMLKNLGEGVDMTMRELLNAFEKHGVSRIDPQGEKFDHHFHQAVTQVETAEVEPGTIVQVLQAGYKIHDRLLIPAMVTVAKQGQTPQKVDTQA